MKYVITYYMRNGLIINDECPTDGASMTLSELRDFFKDCVGGGAPRGSIMVGFTRVDLTEIIAVRLETKEAE